MNTKSPLEDTKLMIKWAYSHIRDLEPALVAFNATNPYTILEEIDPETGDKVIKARLARAVSDDIRRYVRDTADKLRTALDYCTSALAIQNGKSSDGVYFPIANSRKEFTACRTQKKIKNLSLVAQEFICSLEPYKGGKGEQFWMLNKLRNPGSHSFLAPIGHVVQPGPFTLKAGPTGSIAFNLPRWHTPEETVEILRVSGSDNQYQVEFVIDVAFSKIEAIEGQLILPLIVNFADTTRDVIDGIERRFFS